MRKNIALLLTLFIFSTAFSQGKYASIMNSKKLAASIKNVKDRDKDEFFQQYYWVKQMEQLKAVPHLKGIKPKVLYNFVKEVNPKIPVKTMTPAEIELRRNADLSLTQYFTKKDWDNPLVVYNIESYVDPSATTYYTGVNPEKIQELVPKRLYYFTSVNKKTNDEKEYYLWVKEDDFEIVNIIPDEKKQADFYNEVKMYVPSYKISKFVPTVKPGDKREKMDLDYFFITPFQETNDNIVYKTDDFKEFEVIRYKRDGGQWTDIEKRKRR